MHVVGQNKPSTGSTKLVPAEKSLRAAATRVVMEEGVSRTRDSGLYPNPQITKDVQFSKDYSLNINLDILILQSNFNDVNMRATCANSCNRGRGSPQQGSGCIISISLI